MNGIMVYAIVGRTKHFVGAFSDIDSLQAEVSETLDSICRPNWSKDTFFLLNGEEYKLFPEEDDL